MQKEYVIGHKNPDADAICSAIAYADFLRRTKSRPHIQAARCGEIGARTVFILDKAGLDYPPLVMDVRPCAGDICKRNIVSAHRDESLLDVWQRMRASSARNLPVIDDHEHLVGMLSLFKLIELLIPARDAMETTRTVTASLAAICRTIDGEFQNTHNPDEELPYTVTVGALSAGAFNERLQTYDPRTLIVVTGDRPTVQLPAIEYGVAAIVVSGQKHLSPRLLERAKEKNVAVIVSSYDTATSTLMMKCARSVAHAMRTDIITFPEKALVRTIVHDVATTNQALFPVIGEDERLVGVFSKSDLIDPQTTRLVLVDHNEFSQAVTGADEAEILEVIDHHRLGGGLSSREPIRFVNDPVGSTSTIVARYYREVGIEPERPIALCLAAGIISDTLQLTSPTTTHVDRDMLAWLEPLLGTTVARLAEEFFSAGSVLQASSPADAIISDCKHYTQNDWNISVAQVEEQGLSYFWPNKDTLTTALEDYLRKENLHFTCLLITDITRHYSLLLTAGERRIIDAIDYPEIEDGLFELEGIVSRKKQLLPHLTWVLDHVQPET